MTVIELRRLLEKCSNPYAVVLDYEGEEIIAVQDRGTFVRLGSWDDEDKGTEEGSGEQATDDDPY